MTDAAADTGSQNTEISTPQWTEGFSESQMAIVQNKQWASPQDMANGYEHASKMIGADPSTVLKMPGMDDVDGFNSLYTKLGRPIEAKDYTFNMSDEMGGSDFTEWMKSASHEIGLSDKQATLLAGKLDQFNTNSITSETTAYQADLTTQSNELKTEWGAGYEKNLLQSKVAAKSLGITPEQIDGIEKTLGYKETMKLFQSLGEKVGEANFTDGEVQSFNNQMTPAQANAAISNLQNDPIFLKAWSDKFAPGHKEAVDKKAQLMQLAHG